MPEGTCTFSNSGGFSNFPDLKKIQLKIDEQEMNLLEE